MSIHITPIFKIDRENFEVDNLTVNNDASFTGDMDANTATFNSVDASTAEIGDLTVTGTITGLASTITCTASNTEWHYCGAVDNAYRIYSNSSTSDYTYSEIFVLPINGCTYTGTINIGMQYSSVSGRNTTIYVYKKDGTKTTYTTATSPGSIGTITIPDDTIAISLYTIGANDIYHVVAGYTFVLS